MQETGDFLAVPDRGAPDQGLYEIRYPILIPRVVYLGQGAEKTVVQSPWQVLGLIAGPLPAWLAGLIGALLIAALDKFLPELK